MLDFTDKPINPPGPYRFNVISLFAGCGGSSLGYKWAGGRGLAAVEYDDNAVATYHLNHAGTHVLHRDIATVTGDELLTLCDLRAGELDLLDGSPPCQGFSTAGKRIMDDPRNGLFREYVRLLREMRPRAFIMENVSGLVKGKMKLTFADILRDLKASGYIVRAWILNAMYFGVPQTRQRLVFIGARNDLSITPTCPAAQTRPILASAALVGLVIDPDEREFLLAAGRKYVAYQEWARIRPGLTRANVMTDGMGFNCQKWHPNRVGYTIRKNDGNLTMHGAMHWSEPRRFTTAEFTRFGTFPDAFQWVKTKKWGNAVNLIGNSVPPRFMQAVAEHVWRTILLPAAG